MDETPKPGETGDHTRGARDDKAPPAPKSAPPNSPPRQPSVVLPALLVSLAVAGALGVGAAATTASWVPKLQVLVAAPDPRIARLESRVRALEERPPVSAPAQGSGLEARVRALEERPPAPVAAPAPVSAPAIAAGVDKAAHDELVRRLGESEARAADLARRLGLIENADVRTVRADSAASALVLAVGQLRDAAGSGRPFGRELESLRALAEGRREVTEAAERLAPLAAKGVPTVSALRERFDAMARAVTVAARTPSDGTWTDRALARVAGLVAIRRTDERAVEGTSDAVLRAAEQALGRDDLAQAVAALEKLSGPALAAAKGWSADARARAHLDATLADLHHRALAALAGGR